MQGAVYFNLTVLLLFLIVLSTFLLHYTDWFETIGGLLALGGVFSWFAFVSKLLPDDVLKQLQWRTVRFFEKTWVTTAIVGCAAVCLVLSFAVGSVRVEFRQDNFSHYVYVYPEGGAPDGTEPLALSASGSTHLVRWAAPFWGTTARIKLPGLASKRVTFTPWWLNSVYVPHFFDRKIYLFRPSSVLTKFVIRTPVRMRISILRNGTPIWSDDILYEGASYWINCTDDVQIPLSQQMEMLSDIPSEAASQYRALWLSPKAMKWGDVDLSAQHKIKISQVPDNGTVFIKTVEENASATGSFDNAVNVIVLQCIKDTCEPQASG